MVHNNSIMNWIQKPVQPSMVLMEHFDKSIDCLKFIKDTIVFGADKNIYIYSAVTGKVSISFFLQYLLCRLSLFHLKFAKGKNIY